MFLLKLKKSNILFPSNKEMSQFNAWRLSNLTTRQPALIQRTASDCPLLLVSPGTKVPTVSFQDFFRIVQSMKTSSSWSCAVDNAGLQIFFSLITWWLVTAETGWKIVMKSFASAFKSLDSRVHTCTLWHIIPLSIYPAHSLAFDKRSQAQSNQYTRPIGGDKKYGRDMNIASMESKLLHQSWHKKKSVNRSPGWLDKFD